MKIVLATPLYPPDIAEPAPYIKELATRLAREHDVHIVTYGRYVEPIDGVRITAVDKRDPLPVRLLRFALTLRRASRHADLVYAENGPSVEFPLLFLSFITSFRYVLHLGDVHALERLEHRPLLRLLHNLFKRRAESVFGELPPERPELIPFLPRPAQEFERYERNWKHHVESFSSLLRHA